MNTANHSDGGWKMGLRRTADCIPIERLDESLTPFEQSHLAQCSRCQAERALWKRMQEEESTSGEAAAVQFISAEVRRRLNPRPLNVVQMPKRAAKRRALMPSLAAAAALFAAVAIGVLVQRREPSIESPVSVVNVTTYRSAGIAVIAPTGEFASAPTALRWQPVAGATLYEAELLEVDQTLLWRGSTHESSIALPASVIAQFAPGKTVLWQVRARRDQAIIADSGQQRFRLSIAH